VLKIDLRATRFLGHEIACRKYRLRLSKWSMQPTIEARIRRDDKRLMDTLKILPAVVLLLSFTTASDARDDSAQLGIAQDKYRAGDLNGALEILEPLLTADDLDQASKQRVRELAARVLQSRGEEHFRQARIAEAIADFDRQVKLQPDHAAKHWQRGIAYYYANQFEKGARQFELHQTVNRQDVENAAWHFLCIVRAPKGSMEAARKCLIPVTRDSRIPMPQIQQLFAGTMSPEQVLRAGEEAGSTAKFYADLYVGLYYEALKRKDESLRLVARAANNPAAKNNYMGDVARVHGILHKKMASSTQAPQSQDRK
jgi:lipoprotein NlpI